MKAEQRRKEIVNLLTAKKEPLSGGALSEILSASRQIIVQDIALLKASGYEIVSTNRGYVLHTTPLVERVIKVKHTSEQTEDELSTVVQYGGSIIDVFVWHKVYGKIQANLNIFTLNDVKNYREKILSGKSTELMNVTSGYHYHTIRADDEQTIEKIEKALLDKGFIVSEK